MKYFLPLLLLLLLGLAACESEEEKRRKEAERQAQEAQQGLQQGLQQLQDMTEQLQNGEGSTVQPVNFRDLKDMLPSSVAGMSQGNAEGQTTGSMGFTVSVAQADYSEGERSLRLSITDAGGMGMAAMGLAAWAMTSIDRESSDGFERTGMIEGHKSYEKYENGSRSGQVSVLVAGRFIVNAEGSSVEIGTLREAVETLDLGKLADLGRN
jgi:hypothetical protein